MAQLSSIPDEISEFLQRNAERIVNLPQVINIAFSGERKPEAWHVRIGNRQVSRGFNKVAPVTVMLPLKSWRKLMKKNDLKLWQKALDDGQIHVHGDPAATRPILELFRANGTVTNGTGEEKKIQESQETAVPDHANGEAQPKTTTRRKKRTKDGTAEKAKVDSSMDTELEQ